MTHTYITKEIWGSAWDNDVASLRVFMATLRKKIEENPSQPKYIQTHVGIDIVCCGWRSDKVRFYGAVMAAPLCFHLYET